MPIMIERQQDFERWNQVFAGQVDPKEGKKWQRIAYMLGEHRNVELSCSTGQPHPNFWRVTLEHAR
jgi:hypothetical protein